MAAVSAYCHLDLSIAEVLDSHGIDEAAIRRAAPGPLSPAAVRLASTLAGATLGQIEVVSMILAGGYNIEAEALARVRGVGSRLISAVIAQALNAARDVCLTDSSWTPQQPRLGKHPPGCAGRGWLQRRLCRDLEPGRELDL